MEHTGSVVGNRCGQCIVVEFSGELVAFRARRHYACLSLSRCCAFDNVFSLPLTISHYSAPVSKIQSRSRKNWEISPTKELGNKHKMSQAIDSHVFSNPSPLNSVCGENIIPALQTKISILLSPSLSNFCFSFSAEDLVLEILDKSKLWKCIEPWHSCDAEYFARAVSAVASPARSLSVSRAQT